MKRLSLLSIPTLLAACAQLGLEPAGLPPPPEPPPVLEDAIPVPSAFSTALLGMRRVDGVRVEVLVLGSGEIRGNKFSEFKSAQSKLTPPLMAVLIRHPKEGAILFGTGLPEDSGTQGKDTSIIGPIKFRPDQNIIAQLKKRGVASEDVRWIILPDLAPEWSGNSGAFLNAKVLVSSVAWNCHDQSVRGKAGMDQRAFVPEERLKLIDFKYHASYGPFMHGVDLFSDGTIIALDLHGGACGGMGVWLNQDNGSLLLTGPAAFVYDNIYDSALPDKKTIFDLPSFAWNTRAMRAADEAVPRLIILPAYDLSTLKLSPRADISLTP